MYVRACVLTTFLIMIVFLHVGLSLPAISVPLMQDGIGLAAAPMIKELIGDNRKIVDRITHDHIDLFIDLLSKRKVMCFNRQFQP